MVKVWEFSRELSDEVYNSQVIYKQEDGLEKPRWTDAVTM